MNHTPGPWHMVETEPGIEAEMDVFVTMPRWAGGTGLIARVMDADDAALIACAPEMLKALQRITHPMADDDDLAFALDVIARATGA